MATVLLIDDDPDVRNSLAAYLQRVGHVVRVAENGARGLSRLQESRVDVVITDINMPDMDGIEVITALGQAASGVPIIAMSGGGLFDRGMLLDSAAALGADMTLEKPFELARLAAAIESVLKGTGSP